MPGLSKVIVLDPDVRAGRQLQLGFEREGIPAAALPDAPDAPDPAVPGADTGLVVVGGVDGAGVELIRRARGWLDRHGVDAPIVFAGRGVAWRDATAAGADEVVHQPAYLRDVVTIGRLLRGAPTGQRDHVIGNLLDVTGVFTLVRALTALGRSATLTLVRGLRRGEVRFYLGEVTSAQVGASHGQAALHQLLLWTDARFDFRHVDIVRRQQIPLSPEELFADAERFLESVRASSGGLSPAMVLEQDIPRVQSFGKQIPTEVYGVLRMFDGHRALADVLEDSAYRVFETLRVAQRAVDAGLLRVTERQPPRPRWRTVLAIEDWLVGGERPDPARESAQIGAVTPPSGVAAQAQAARQAQAAARDAQNQQAQQARSGRKKRGKRKRRPDTPAIATPIATPGAASGAAPGPREIDWGALVPRIVGAEVGPLAGVVPASHVSGEIVIAARASGESRSGAQGPSGSVEAAEEPSVVFDATAGLATTERAEAERAEAERAEAERAEAERAEAERAAAERAAAERAAAERVAAERAAAERAAAERVAAERAAAEQVAAERAAAERVAAERVAAEHAAAERVAAERAAAERAAAATVSVSSQPAPVVGELEPGDTRPERGLGAGAATGNAAAVPCPPGSAEPVLLTAAGVVLDSAMLDTSDAITVPITASIPASTTAPTPTATAPTATAPTATAPITASISARPAPALPAADATPDATPGAVEDEPSDGVVRHRIATAETAPVKRRPPPSEAIPDDRPVDTTGEITMPRARPSIEIRQSEPSILVADLAAAHAAVSAVAGAQAAAPATPDGASPARDAAVAGVRDDARVFSEVEEEFFRAGHEKEAVAESFADLDEGYRPVGFWERLRGRLSGEPVPPGGTKNK
jgi:hypothetical protein